MITPVLWSEPGSFDVEGEFFAGRDEEPPRFREQILPLMVDAGIRH